MNRISIKEAIASGSWYECHALVYDDPIDFRFRILEFERKSVAEIDPSVIFEGVLWLLSIEVVHATKVAIDPWRVRNSMTVVDGDGFEFEAIQDGSLEYDRDSGLRRFSGVGAPISPKVKVSGTIAFGLPDEENTYSLAFKTGSVKEA